MKNVILLLILFTIYSPQAFSWGKTGHRIVGEIAQRNLDKKALKGLKDLAGTEDLSRLSTWRMKLDLILK